MADNIVNKTVYRTVVYIGKEIDKIELKHRTVYSEQRADDEGRRMGRKKTWSKHSVGTSKMNEQ